MIEFLVTDMTCGHCVSTVTRALKAVDPGARVEVDLRAKRVRVDATSTAGILEEAIREAGYTPVAVTEA